MKQRITIKELKDLGYYHIKRFNSMQLFIAWKGNKQYLLSYTNIIGIYDHIDKLWWVKEDTYNKVTNRHICGFSLRYPVKFLNPIIFEELI